MLQFFKKLCVVAKVLIVPDSMMTSQSESQRAGKIKRRILRYLKCLNKESVVASSIEL